MRHSFGYVFPTYIDGAQATGNANHFQWNAGQIGNAFLSSASVPLSNLASGISTKFANEYIDNYNNRPDLNSAQQSASQENHPHVEGDNWFKSLVRDNWLKRLANDNWLKRVRNYTSSWADENIRQPLNEDLKPYRDYIAIMREVNHELMVEHMEPIRPLYKWGFANTASSILSGRRLFYASRIPKVEEETTLLLQSYNSVESVIEDAGKLTRLKGGVRQGTIEGNINDVFNGLATQYGAKIEQNGNRLFFNRATFV